MLGKRKRDATIWRRPKDDAHTTNARDQKDNGLHDALRRHFEATFDPLPDLNQNVRPSETESNDVNLLSDDATASEGSEWSGLSGEDGEAPAIEVVEHTSASDFPEIEDETIDKIFHKSFMSSRPPRETRTAVDRSQTSQPTEKADPEEATNLKHDINLQRLLQESHLLGGAQKSSVGGTKRHKATDMRLQTLGSKGSLFDQEKMPMSHRRGILAKASSKDASRRQEAKENGIVLEKFRSKKNTVRDSRRDRGVDVPVVGKFKGGTLQLSRKDVASIQGPRRDGGRNKRRR